MLFHSEKAMQGREIRSCLYFKRSVSQLIHKDFHG